MLTIKVILPILDLLLVKNSIMVIDTGGTQLIGRKLLEKIRTISNLPISHIVITHSHPDHFLGTQAFSDENAKIVGHEKLNRSLVNNFEFYRNSQYTNIELEEIKNLKLVEAEVLVKTNQKNYRSR